MLLFSYLLAAILTRSLFGLDKKKINPQVKKIKLKKNSKKKPMKLLRIARAHGLLIVYTSRTYLFDIKQLGLMIFMICFIIFRFSIFFGCSSSFFYNLVFLFLFFN
jgi:hypothetical protein